MSHSAPEIAQVNGVDICVQTFGDPADASVLLIMGSSASMDWWEDEFCERLAAGGRFVVRYDHRDTGQSVTYPPGEPGYSFGDLVDDAVDLLDHFGLERAHLVGMSMGGAIAQLIALDHPERVASLTLIATGPPAPGPENPDLPSMSNETVERFMAIPTPDWSDREAVIDHQVAFSHILAGSIPLDESSFRDLAGRIFDRTIDMESTMTNHHRVDM